MHFLKSTYVKACERTLTIDELLKEFQPSDHKALYKYINDIWKVTYNKPHYYIINNRIYIYTQMTQLKE